MRSPNVNNAVRIFPEKWYKRASEKQRLKHNYGAIYSKENNHFSANQHKCMTCENLEFDGKI